MAEIIKIDSDTYRIEDNGVRFFILEGTEKALMIDSGMNTPEARTMAENLTNKPLELLNTHADRDHISGNAAFDRFYMDPAEEENYREAGGTGTVIPVHDGDVIDLGGRPLEIIGIPGHTPGSIAILDINKRVLFSGDSVQDGYIFMFGKFRNLEAYVSSMKKLLKYMDRPTCITECGISLEEFEKHREEIVKRALADACTVANPRKVEAKDINRILDKIAK